MQQSGIKVQVYIMIVHAINFSSLMPLIKLLNVHLQYTLLQLDVLHIFATQVCFH